MLSVSVPAAVAANFPVILPFLSASARSSVYVYLPLLASVHVTVNAPAVFSPYFETEMAGTFIVAAFFATAFLAVAFFAGAAVVVVAAGAAAVVVAAVVVVSAANTGAAARVSAVRITAACSSYIIIVRRIFNCLTIPNIVESKVLFMKKRLEED